MKRWSMLSALVVMLLLTVTLAGRSVNAEEPDVQDGDLFIGAVEGRDSWGSFAGPRIVWRVRDGVAERYCQGPASASDPGFFGIPEQMLVDSRGRIVFVAKLGPEGFRVPRGLFRCAGMGSTPERLAYFSDHSEDAKEGFPDPFPDQAFGRISGLHLATVQSIEITDGHQRLISEDAYVMAMQEVHPSTRARVETKVRHYRATTGQWGSAPDAALCCANNGLGTMPAMVNYGGATYSSAGNVLRKSTDPLRLEATGSIGEFDFELSASLFGGHREVSRLLLDNVDFPNRNSGCDPNLPQPPSLMEPQGPTGAYSVMADFDAGIVYDGYGDLGLVLRSDSGATGVPYLANVSEALINDDPGDDLGEWFYRSTTGCRPEASLKHSEILPFWNPDGSGSNGLAHGTMTASPHGLVGIGGNPAGSLARVVRGVGLEVIAGGFVGAQSVAAYPPIVPPASGMVVVIRINSPVDVLVTDPAGNRIGVDAATAEAVNDFGQNGFDSGPGEPRFLAIKNPSPGTFDVDAIGTGDGPFSIQVYSAILGAPAVDLNEISVSGTASPGSTGEHDFTLSADATAAFVATHEALRADAGSDQSVELDGSRLAAVALDGSGSTDDSDVRALRYTWTIGDLQLGNGRRLAIELPLGVHTVSLTVDDGEVTATDEVQITVIDPTAPVVTAGVAGADGHGRWYVSDVAITWSVIDRESEITSTTGCEDGSVTTDTAGVTFTCEARSAGGATSEAVRVQRDATPPGITAERSPGANAHGWNSTDVTVSFTCGDALSGIERCPGTVTLADEGAGQHVSATAVDVAGNRAEAAVGEINIDRTAPVVTYSGHEGPYTVDGFLDISCAATDVLSGIESDTCEDVTGAAYEFEIGTTTFSAEAVDLAGNTASTSVTVVVEVTYGSVCNVTKRFATNHGVARSLCQKLEQAGHAEQRGRLEAKSNIVDAFIQHVQALGGGAHLSEQHAEILVRLAREL